MSPGEMRLVLLILASLTADSTASDPCVIHTVLDQPWRSSGCHRTQCSSRWMDDGNLVEGWYRFSSYDNVKIPESAVRRYRCSGWRPGWLNGSHPSVGDGEVTRTVCFSWVTLTCQEQQIKIKNCDGYFVYRLKPTPGDYSVYCAGSVHSDPCVIHTVLDQPWRSTDCSNTQCTNDQWKSDANLAEGWYRFNSSGGWKIPETTVPANHCSGERPGWLNGSHPSVSEGEVTRTVCFKDAGDNGAEDGCSINLDIKVKNCSSYFVYQLKPTPSDQTVYCTAADSALGDPCVNHIVLDQPWRSTDCEKQTCSGNKWMKDDNITVGWYRLKSSGGWKIPETVVLPHHCSGKSPGWLNGPHPSVGDGEVTRTVCFSWNGNNCNRQHEIKVKQCEGFFVYRLEPTLCCGKVYCSDPHSAPTGEPQDTTAQPQEDLSTVPEPGTSSDHQMSTGKQIQESSTGESTQEPSSVPVGDTSSDPHTVPTDVPQGTAQPREDLSTVPELDTSSDPHSVPTGEPQETTAQPQEDLSTVPEPDTSSDPPLDTTQEAQGATSGDSGQGSTSDPAGSASSDPHSVPTGEPQDTTAQPLDDLSTVPEPDTSSDPLLDTTQEPQGAMSGDSGQGSTSDPAGSASSGPEGTGPEGHKESTTGEPSGTPSTAPEEETCSAPWLLTDEECERLISGAQVLFVGDQDLGSPEDTKAYLQELREMLRKQLPCKQVEPKGQQTGKREKRGRN